MEFKNKSKVNIFLIELIIVILIFAISAAIIVNLFAAASKVNRESRDKSVSLIKIESIIEEYKSFEYAIEGNDYLESLGFPKLYDKDWIETTDETQAVYSIVLLSSQKKYGSGSVFTINLTSFEKDNGKELINLKGSKYFYQ
jgi:type II secretory pathway pseudopilin PulG